MSLHIKSPGEAPGVYPIAQRGKDLKHLSFTIVELGGSLKEHGFDTGEEEICLDFYSGPVRVEAEGPQGRWTADVVHRPSMQEAGSMVYLPAGSSVKLTRLDGAAKVTIASAAGKPGGKPALIPPAEAIENHVGKDNWSRTVFTHIADNIDAAHLIAGETLNRPGGWSSAQSKCQAGKLSRTVLLATAWPCLKEATHLSMSSWDKHPKGNKQDSSTSNFVKPEEYIDLACALYKG